ncbi:MAG: YybH family protein [Candidatus Omnitrophota bacterium]
MLTLFTLMLTVPFESCGLCQRSSDAIPKIRDVMERQKKAWNAGDLNGFMAAYWKSDQFTFQGKTRLSGWETLYNKYKTGYSGEKMGQLDFTRIDIKPISDDHAYVLGHWKVTTKDSAKEGEFTLILRRFGSDWKIILDHSS